VTVTVSEYDCAEMFWAAGTEPHTVKACAAAALQVTPLGVYTEPPTVEPHTVLPAQLVHGLVVAGCVMP